jgi:hypothetical protein
MLLRWEPVPPDLFVGRSGDGHALAHVAHVFGRDGTDLGWGVWLVLEQGELFDRYPTPEAGQQAAEHALDRLAGVDDDQLELWETSG